MRNDISQSVDMCFAVGSNNKLYKFAFTCYAYMLNINVHWKDVCCGCTYFDMLICFAVVDTTVHQRSKRWMLDRPAYVYTYGRFSFLLGALRSINMNELAKVKSDFQIFFVIFKLNLKVFG